METDRCGQTKEESGNITEVIVIPDDPPSPQDIAGPSVSFSSSPVASSSRVADTLQSQLVIDVGEEMELRDNVNSYGIQFLGIQQIELYGKSPIYKIYDNVTKRQIYMTLLTTYLFFSCLPAC